MIFQTCRLLTAFKLRKQCERHELYVKTQSENILRHDYSLHMNEVVKTFTEEIHNMGNVSVDKTATNIVPAFYKDMRVSVIADMSGKSRSHCFRSLKAVKNVSLSVPYVTEAIRTFLPLSQLLKLYSKF
jgi:hypothetical protein